MDFVEEKTPSGYILKILFNKMKFLVFNSRGESFAADKEGRSLLHKLPSIVFLGGVFVIERDYTKEYSLLKVRDDTIILPYRNIIEKKRKFLFIHYVSMLDIIPARITTVKSYSSMLKDIPSDTEIDYLVVDESLSEIELSVIASRYRPGGIIKVFTEKSDSTRPVQDEKGSDYISINTMSENPVFLAAYHLRNMALSNLNQLLLDFDISAFDTQFIIHFINDILENRKNDADVVRNRSMLTDLKNAYNFYLALIIKDDALLKETIESETDYRKLSPYKTLVSKVRSMNPGKDHQLLYTEYENILYEKEENLKAG